MRPSFISILLIAISTVCALPVAPDDNAPGPPPAKGSLPPDDDAKVATPAPSNSDARSRPPADFYNARPPVSDSSRGDYLYESTRPGAKRLPASLRQALRGAALQDARLRHRPPARGPLLYQPNRQASGGHNAQGRPLAEPAPPGNNAQGRSQALFKPVLPSNNGQGGSVAKPLAALPGNNAQETGYLLPNSAGAAEEPPIDKTFPDPAELQRLMENKIRSPFYVPQSSEWKVFGGTDKDTLIASYYSENKKPTKSEFLFFGVKVTFGQRTVGIARYWTFDVWFEVECKRLEKEGRLLGVINDEHFNFIVALP